MVELASTDEALFVAINGLVGQSHLVDEIIILIVSDYLVPGGLALLLLSMWFIGKSRDRREEYQIGVFVCLTSMALSNLTVLVINTFYSRARPFIDHDVNLLFYEPTDPSFPSNSIAATCGIAMGIWGVNRRLSIMPLIVVGLYGLARIYAGIHYPLDIIGGAAIAALVTFFVFKLSKLIRPLLTTVLRIGRILCLA